MLHRPFSRVLAAAAFLTLSPEAFAQTGVVNVYTSREPALIKPALDAFTQATAIKVNTVFIQNGLEERVKAEGANSPADIIITVDAAKLVNAVDLGILQKPSNMLTEAAIAPSLRDPEGRWSAVTLRSRVVYASKDRVKENAIHYEDLADPKWKGKVAFAGSDKSGSAFSQMLQIIHNEGETAGWALFGRMMENFIITGSSTAVIRGAAQGEYAMALTLEDNAQRFIDGGAPLKIVYPKEGISIQADAMALVAKAPNPAAGKALMDYIVSAEGQSVIVKASGRRPIRTDVPGPEKAIDAKNLPVNTYPPEWGVAKSKEYLDRYLRLARR